MQFRLVVSCCALVGLAACGGGGNVGNPIDLSAGPGTYDDLDTATDFLKSRVASRDATTFPASMPTYHGIILMGEDLSTADGNPTINTGYIGQVQLTANFDGTDPTTLTGTASNFYQTNIDSIGDPGGVGSSVASDSWTITGSNFVGADLTISVSGTVDGISVSGDLDGSFKGTASSTDAVAVVGATDPSDPLTVDGLPAGYDAIIAAD